MLVIISFLFQGADYGLNVNGARRMGSKRSPRGPILHIAKVRKEDAGTYTCTASNGVGTMSADQIELNVLCKYTMIIFYPILIILSNFAYLWYKNTWLTIHFSDPPEVSAAERAVYSGLRGKADLTCIVKAEPRANVSIYTNLFFKKIIQVIRHIITKLR